MTPTPNLLIGLPGPTEMIIIGVILLLLFGHRLPGMMRSLGKGVTEFKRGLKEPDDPDSSKSLAPGDDASSK